MEFVALMLLYNAETAKLAGAVDVGRYPTEQACKDQYMAKVMSMTYFGQGIRFNMGCYTTTKAKELLAELKFAGQDGLIPSQKRP